MPYGPTALSATLHRVEPVRTERVDRVAGHLLAHGDRGERMGERGPGRLGLEDRLGLLVEVGAGGGIGCRLGLGDEVLETLIAPFGPVR